MRTFKFFIMLFLAACSVGLVGCATVSKPQPTTSAQSPAPSGMSWDDRRATLAKIKNWNINAAIAIHDRAKPNSGSASMHWQQAMQDYTILLYGPLGAGSMKLIGKPGNVMLESGDGKKATASTPEQLLAAQTGWHLPVSNLYYWIRGLPVPSIPAQKSFDADNHLIELAQGGWRIQFLRYTSVNQTDLPTKIFLDNPNLSVKIIVSQWQI